MSAKVKTPQADMLHAAEVTSRERVFERLQRARGWAQSRPGGREWSWLALRRAMGLSDSSMSRAKNQGRDFSAAELYALAELLEVSPGYLAFGIDQPNELEPGTTREGDRTKRLSTIADESEKGSKRRRA